MTEPDHCLFCNEVHSDVIVCKQMAERVGMLTVASPIPPDFMIQSGDRLLMTITSEGVIVIEDGVQWDEAARGFIKALREVGATVTLRDHTSLVEAGWHQGTTGKVP